MKITFLGNFGVDYSSENHHKRSLEALGHSVIALQEGETPAEVVLDWAKSSQMFVWVHTHGWSTPSSAGLTMVDVLKELKKLNIPTVTYHLDLWFGLERHKDLENDEFYKHIGHFFTVDKLMADWFNEHTEVKGHYLRAGVFGEEVYKADSDGYKYDVVFVGSRGYHPEWQWRPQLIDWLKETYGDRFIHVGGDGQIPTTRGAALNQLYADSKVAVGDSLVLGFDYPYYWSDRVYETMGRGGFLLMPEIKGLETEFTPEELATFKFGDFTDLKKKIDFYIINDAYRETMRQNGFNKVKNNYTYKHRWSQIIKELGL
jgi:glycosyltransferase involved in cell wall biosynthesis